MDKNIAKGLSEITRKEWILYQWLENTTFGDEERHFIPIGSRTPDEAMQAAEEWDFMESVRNDEEGETETA